MKTCLLSALLLFSCYAYFAVGAPPQQQRGPNCRTHPTDLVFIIDSSRSVQPSEFERVKDFLSQVIESLDVGVNSTRVGVLNYASSVKNEFSLKTHKTKAALLQAVKKIQPLSTGTMTGLAIQYAINQAFTEGEGARLRSPGIKKMTTLRQIASEPLDEHVDYVESYSVIQKLGKKFQEAFCEMADLCSTGDHDCQQICVSTPGSYTCACRDGFTLNEDGKTCNACGASAIDLVFVIDGSKSVRPENFDLVKQLINQVVESLDVGDKKAHVGVVQYSSSVRQEFPLGRFNNKKDIKSAVKKMAYMEKGTMTGQAIKYLIDNTFTISNGGRPGVSKVGIVFTDGRSQDYINDAALKAKEL
ncbi:PREDICTED: cartilage matrix protein-like, partial [Nanorana parkeri]|uniref:cartilage matrix protein-like n=1 Tax=Nanorana parkeri TaxID=125878 RepID=UPI0008543F64